MKLFLYQTEEQLRKKRENWYDDEGYLVVCGIELVPGKVSHCFSGAFSPVKREWKVRDVKEELLMQSS